MPEAPMDSFPCSYGRIALNGGSFSRSLVVPSKVGTTRAHVAGCPQVEIWQKDLNDWQVDGGDTDGVGILTPRFLVLFGS
jgi:hypothetical protein